MEIEQAGGVGRDCGWSGRRLGSIDPCLHLLTGQPLHALPLVCGHTHALINRTDDCACLTACHGPPGSIHVPMQLPTIAPGMYVSTRHITKLSLLLLLLRPLLLL